jgi:hypothetical protein
MISIGSGSRYRPDAGRAVLREGVDYLFMDFMSESTLPRAYLKKRRGRPGFDEKWLTRSLEAFLPPAERHGTTIVTNAGAADPRAAGERALEIAREADVSLDVTVVTGDDCTDLVRARAEEFGVDPGAMLSANAYIGAEEIVGALERPPGRDGDGVHLVVGGRIADHSLIVAPIVHEFGWDPDQWDELGWATAVAQLLECDYQATGGYFMEPGRKPVPDPHRLGLPIADVHESGRAVIRKPEGSGGRIDRATLREQLFYEIHDPSAKLTPDVTADLTGVRFEAVGEDEVAVTGGTGRERPSDLKVLVGTAGGFRVEARKPYAGPNAEGRARMAGEIVRDRLDLVHGVEDVEELRTNVVGVDAVFGSASTLSVPFDSEVELRVAARTTTEETAELVFDEVSSLAPVGPAAGIGNPYSMNDSIERIVDVDAVYLPREAVVDAIEHTSLRAGATPEGR